MSERTVKKRLNVFERYLSIWVALCMVAGVALGKLLPGFTDAVRRLDHPRRCAVHRDGLCLVVPH